ncbi:Schizosaccharomyces pombe specific protein [Schizosaccharomyces pombe]|uniref:Uncharacterized protein C17A2.11, mitochondrial n=1 Tax=Schizosaccharomyces pombe (strain 972 / ATCC 24843) TaxID=284812 RepID=YF2B_SCHPO|nr:uncharacterized protein SPAC17A2.11 [Schizosaccharomyces pombe]O13761.2 RecName: Full=Uncharacterized protein C17A2.11, mitochondrial; Flags: Precursor [Schizosaccharomyces pombe 972h-]CAB16564.2 sequence orphan [Schizosaccharomyces pombe]|eukprot:NP_594245.1 uncharacterized protein SPAC17A2.11 [Schizosaccharomyces pombe]
MVCPSPLRECHPFLQRSFFPSFALSHRDIISTRACLNDNSPAFDRRYHWVWEEDRRCLNLGKTLASTIHHKGGNLSLQWQRGNTTTHIATRWDANKLLLARAILKEKRNILQDKTSVNVNVNKLIPIPKKKVLKNRAKSLLSIKSHVHFHLIPFINFFLLYHQIILSHSLFHISHLISFHFLFFSFLSFPLLSFILFPCFSLFLSSNSFSLASPFSS